MRRRRLPPRPAANPDGIYLMDPDTREEVFVTFAELQEMCEWCLNAENDVHTGKVHFSHDETYNLRRRKDVKAKA